MGKMDTGYIDEELKELTYDHANHLVQMSYGAPGGNETDGTILFGGCLSVAFNKWHTGDISFFFHEITIEDIEIDGIQFYKCNLVIPMMDCQITCLTIEVYN
jgi:hypothetical protein